jgi:Domain of unknown function (DUF5642)
VRPFWIGVILVLLPTACAHPPAPKPAAPPPSSAHNTEVNPANIKKVVRELPPNYEVTTGIPTAVSPRAIWSRDTDGTVKPAQCGTLADPGDGRDQSAQGMSASGAGGVVDAIVVSLPGPAVFDADVVAACGQWRITSAQTTISVRLTDPPHIDGAETVALVADIKSSVEAGTEIDSRTYTFIAYLGNYYAFTTLTTDPGSALPALPAQFAADLLVKTVSTLRS